MTERDKRALIGLSIAVVLFLLLQTDIALPGLGGGPTGATSVEAAEQKLRLTRAQAGRGPLVEAAAKSARESLEGFEEGLLASENAALAKAEMRQIVEDLLRAEGIAMQSAVFAAVERQGEHYAVVPVAVDVSCRIEQLVNWLAAVGNAPKLLATPMIRVNSANKDTKAVKARVTVAGFLPVDRTPELIEDESGPGGLR